MSTQSLGFLQKKYEVEGYEWRGPLRDAVPVGHLAACREYYRFSSSVNLVSDNGGGAVGDTICRTQCKRKASSKSRENYC